MSRRKKILRRAVLWLALLLVAGPVLLIALYRFVPVPGTPLMIIRMVQGQGLEKTWTPLEQISVSVPDMVIAAEDNRFCIHSGIDWPALRTEIDRGFSGERPRGASTLTMQVAKNVFLWPGRDPVRKGLEAYLSMVIEALWPKQRILEIYLKETG